MKYFFKIITVVIAPFIYCQNMTDKVSSPDFNSIAYRNKLINANNLDKDIKGSPYLSKDFIPSRISKVYNTVATRYNIYKDEIEFKDDEKIFLVPKNDPYSKISIDNGTNIILIEGKYYINLYEKDNKYLLKKLRIKYNNPRFSSNSYQESEQASYEDMKPLFYIYDNSFIEINNKNLENHFKSKNIKNFTKDHKSNLKDDKDLITLAKFLF